MNEPGVLIGGCIACGARLRVKTRRPNAVVACPRCGVEVAFPSPRPKGVESPNFAHRIAQLERKKDAARDADEYDEAARLRDTIEQLGRLGDACSVGGIASSYRATKDRSVLKSLQLFTDSSDVPSLADLLTDTDRYLRSAAVEQLAAIGTATATVHVVAALNDLDCGVRRAVALSLKALGWTPATPRERVFFALPTADSDPAGVRGIDTSGPGPLLEALDFFDRHADRGSVRFLELALISRTLGDIGDKSAVEPLIAALHRHLPTCLGRSLTYEFVPETVVALLKLGSSVGLGLLLATTADGSHRAIASLVPGHDYRPFFCTAFETVREANRAIYACAELIRLLRDHAAIIPDDALTLIRALPSFTYPEVQDRGPDVQAVYSRVPVLELAYAEMERRKKANRR